MLSMQISRSCPHKNSMLVMVAPLLLQLHITKVKCCACPKCDWHASQASCQVSHAGANMTNPSQAAARSSHVDAMHCITSEECTHGKHCKVTGHSAVHQQYACARGRRLPFCAKCRFPENACIQQPPHSVQAIHPRQQTTVQGTSSAAVHSSSCSGCSMPGSTRLAQTAHG